MTPTEALSILDQVTGANELRLCRADHNKVVEAIRVLQAALLKLEKDNTPVEVGK